MQYAIKPFDLFSKDLRKLALVPYGLSSAVIRGNFRYVSRYE